MLEILGRGGMGAVYKARQISLDRIVALKLLPLEVSVDENFADRFRREARALAKLSHRHIIAIHEFGQTSDGHLYFAMEFVEGANLSDVIHQIGLTPEQALSLAGQICSALACAHGKGVIHRDIKPSNVMIDMDSHAKVADFGLARVTDRSTETIGATMSGTVMGTLGYMAPEQMLDMNVDHRADIYSLGVMLYEMLCGETPQGAFSLPSERISCDVRIDQIVVKAMQQSPDRRYQTTYEMASAVESARLPPPPAAVQQPLVVNAHHIAAPVPQPKKSHGGIIAVSILAVLAVAAISLAKLGSKGVVQPVTPPVESVVSGATATEPELPPTAVPALEEPVRQLTTEESVKRLMSTKGWEDIGIMAIPDGTISVEIEDRSIADLSPLAGLLVSELNMHGTPITDLSTLEGLPLRALDLDDTPVEDISVLKKLPLVRLSMSNTRVSDLSPLRDLKLQRLMLDRNVQEIDLAPLAGMSTLENIVLPERHRQIELLRDLPNLRFISYERGEASARGSATPAADFWRSYDEKQSAPVEPLPAAKTEPEVPPKPLSETGKWLAEQEPQWQAAYARNVSGPFEREAEDLKEKYISRLKKEIAEAANGGRSEISTALSSEFKLLTSGGDVPHEDDETTPAMLKSNRATYRKHLSGYDAKRTARAKIIHASIDAVLAKRLSLLTQRRLLDEAAEIKAKREQLAVAWVKSPLSTGPAGAAEKGFLDLFDGKSLTGWKVSERPESFAIEDGAIRAKGNRAHAFYAGPHLGARFKNFELRMDVMTRPQSNGGVFIHTEFQEKGLPEKGYEIQVNNTHSDWRKSGGIYAVVDNKVPLEDNVWMRYVIVVKNGVITSSINDRRIAKLVEPEGKSRLLAGGGTIALQAHDPGSTVLYKNIRIKPLD